jgi:hypothetical protein
MSDIKLENSEEIAILCDNLKVQGHDLLLDSASRRGNGNRGYRRALVHDQNDGLTVNFNGDYPGGVTINDVRSLSVTGDLQFKISHRDEVVIGRVGEGGDHHPDETVTLGEVIKALRREIVELRAQIANLGPRP